MTSKAETLHHPTLPSTVDVDDSALADWVAAGWLKSEPKVVREKDDQDSK